MARRNGESQVRPPLRLSAALLFVLVFAGLSFAQVFPTCPSGCLVSKNQYVDLLNNEALNVSVIWTKDVRPVAYFHVSGIGRSDSLNFQVVPYANVFAAEPIASFTGSLPETGLLNCSNATLTSLVQFKYASSYTPTYTAVQFPLRTCSSTEPQTPLVLDVPPARQLSYCNLQLTATSENLGVLQLNMTFKSGALVRRILLNVTIPGTGTYYNYPSELSTCTSFLNCTLLSNSQEGPFFSLVLSEPAFDTPSYSSYSAPIYQILVHLNRIRCTTSNLSPYCSSWTLTSISITQQRSLLCNFADPRPVITLFALRGITREDAPESALDGGIGLSAGIIAAIVVPIVVVVAIVALIYMRCSRRNNNRNLASSSSEISIGSPEPSASVKLAWLQPSTSSNTSYNQSNPPQPPSLAHLKAVHAGAPKKKAAPQASAQVKGLFAKLSAARRTSSSSSVSSYEEESSSSDPVENLQHLFDSKSDTSSSSEDEVKPVPVMTNPAWNSATLASNTWVEDNAVKPRSEPQHHNAISTIQVAQSTTVTSGSSHSPPPVPARRAPPSHPVAQQQQQDLPKVTTSAGRSITLQSKEKRCLMCDSEDVDSIFEPCGHIAVCFGCSLKIISTASPTCPLCSATIRSSHRI